MTLDLLLQIIRENIKHLDEGYPPDIKWSTAYMIHMLEEILNEYEKRNKMEWINELHDFVHKEDKK